MRGRNNSKTTRRFFFTSLISGFFFLLTFLSFGLWCTYHEIGLRRDLDEASVRHSFDIMEFSMASIYRALSTDMTALTSLTSLHLWLQNPTEQGLQLMIHDWSALMRSFGRYQRLYYADEKGQPVVALQYDYPTDKILLLDPQKEQLPRLLKEGAELSASDIIQEQLPTMTPGTEKAPTFEEAATVFDSLGRRRGTLVMTYDAGELMRLFQRVDRGFPYFLFVFNEKGSPVYCRDATDVDWNLDTSSLRPQGCTLPPLDEKTWITINSQRFGSFYDQRGLNYYFKASIPGFRTGAQAMTVIFISCYPASLQGYETESIFTTALLVFFHQQGLIMAALILVIFSLALFLRHRKAKTTSSPTTPLQTSENLSKQEEP